MSEIPPPPTLQEWVLKELDHILSEEGYPRIQRSLTRALRDVVREWPNITYLGVPLTEAQQAEARQL